MSRWYGKVGYVEPVEETPGDWIEKVTERNYYGDTIKNSRLLQTSGGVNDNINIANQISIVADPYAIQNFHAIRYVEFMGSNWKVTTVDVQRPRLILTIGGLYNGEQA